MRIRRRNWIIKRIALGFAVAALVAPAAAQARVDEGINGQPNLATEGYTPFVTDFPSYEANTVKAGDYGMPRAMPSDYAAQRGDQIEVVRTQPRTVSRGDIEVVRTQPRSTLRSSDLIENSRVSPRSPVEVVSASGFDWSDAGVGAGLVIALVLVGGVAFLATKRLGQPQTA
ncbi:MAG TPA: hypothetical protein VGJ49_01545 [Gaiellaceae bacterium]|jgi:hypothetical protein